MKLSKEKLQKKMKERLWGIMGRCRNDAPYRERGIKCDLSVDDLIFMWERDNADGMDVPSVDRIDGMGNYTLSNCRFMELDENMRRGRCVSKKREKINYAHISVRVTADKKKALKREAEKDNRTLSNYVTLLIDAHLQRIGAI